MNPLPTVLYLILIRVEKQFCYIQFYNMVAHLMFSLSPVLSTIGFARSSECQSINGNSFSDYYDLCWNFLIWNFMRLTLATLPYWYWLFYYFCHQFSVVAIWSHSEYVYSMQTQGVCYDILLWYSACTKCYACATKQTFTPKKTRYPLFYSKGAQGIC